MRTIKDSFADRIPILLLFIVPLLALAHWCFGITWTQSGCFLPISLECLPAGLLFFAILKMRKGKRARWGMEFPDYSRICAVDATALSFHAPLLVGPCVLLGAIAHILQRGLRQPKGHLDSLTQCPIHIHLSGVMYGLIFLMRSFLPEMLL